ncbi:MAG: hypothetical protein KDB26_07075 [Microthrixaceae bacterium]|nr:hypothetical protein [Microthrixaceae bacterium]
MPSALHAAYATSREAGASALVRSGPDIDQLTDILSAIGASTSDGGTWFALEEALLLCLDGPPPTWHEVIDVFGLPVVLDEVHDMAARFIKVLGPKHQSQLSEVNATQITALIEAADDRGEPRVIGAVGLLLAVDERRHETFDDIFAAALEFKIRPQRAYPVAVHNPRPQMAESATTRPGNIPSVMPQSFAHHARLGRTEHGIYGISLDWDLKGRLTPFRTLPNVRMATAHVHGTLNEDFNIVAGEDLSGIVANHGPKDIEGTLDAFKKLLGLAANAQVQHVVVPEYTVTDSMIGEIARTVGEISAETKARTFRPMLVAAGSSLVGNTNQGTLIVSGPMGTCETKTYTKFTRARLGNATEDMHSTTPEISVWRSGDMALAVLICRDAMDKTAIDLLGEAGVNILLVPSFSDRVTGLAGSAERLSTDSQAWLAIGVAPRHILDGGERFEAFFKGPFGGDKYPAQTYVPEASTSTTPLPCLWVFDSKSDFSDVDSISVRERSSNKRVVSIVP